MSHSPNFLILVSDQHVAGAIGALGHPAVKTPWLDRLVAAGVTFDNAYCAYPICTPSRASLMTGHYTRQHGVWDVGSPLRSDIPTWAHVLRCAGYATALSGRMHFVGYDKMHGFERRLGPETRPMLTPYAFGDWDLPQQDDHVMLGSVRKAGPTGQPSPLQEYDRGVTEAALAELDRLTSHPEQKPWALTLGYAQPHFPYEVSREYYDLYDGVDIPSPRPAPGGKTFEECIPAQLTGIRRWLGLSTDGLTGEQIKEARRCYYGMITHLDAMMGRVLARLEESGAADNTWIIYTADHGENLGEHGFWSKQNFYEDSVRVPLIVVPPRYERAGARCSAPVSLIDWMSTILDMTGEATSFEAMPGRSLLPLVQDPSLRWEDRTVIADYASEGTRVPMRMVRQGCWKAWFAPGFAPVLFNLENDPEEWNDVAAQPEHKAVLDELRELGDRENDVPMDLTREIHRYHRRLKYISQAEARTTPA